MTTAIQSSHLSDINSAWITAFSKERKEPAWLLELRLKAFENYSAQPWPDKRNEKWRRTELDLLNWNELKFESSQPNITKNPQGTLTLEEALKQNEDEIRSAWTTAVARAQDNKFASLTLALGNGGTCFFIQKNKTSPVPFYENIPHGNPQGAVFLVNFIFVEPGADAQIWEELNTAPTQTNDKLNFVSSYTHVHVKANAHASFMFLQEWDQKTAHFQFQDITQDASSQLNTVAISVGGRIFHNESTIHLNGSGAENKVLGLLFGNQDQNFENWITQNHNAEHTNSDIRYRGALKGKAKSFFSGMVSIIKKAQKSDAFQSCKNLLLSKEARADAIPNLEILADDVKCAHGAAVGPVDADQKYYLQTRGVPPKRAEEIIIQGFFEPVIAAVPSTSIQDRLRNFMEEKILK